MAEAAAIIAAARTTLAVHLQRMDGVTELLGFSLGRAAARADTPALYMFGIVNGQRGVMRSDDCARSWVRINDDQHQWGLYCRFPVTTHLGYLC